MSADPESDSLGRGRMTQSKRIELLERDRAQQSRVLTALVDASKAFTPEQLAQLRAAMREELADAGLRLDGVEHQDEAREDFRFLRRLRRLFNGASQRIGSAILTGLIVVAGIIITTGFWAWISNGGKASP